MRITWKRVVSCGITMSQTEWSVPMELHRNRAGRLGSPSLRQAIFASPLVTWFMVVLGWFMLLILLQQNKMGTLKWRPGGPWSSLHERSAAFGHALSDFLV